MSSRVKVSVLVPIYNVEKFLPECLDSLISQTLKEIEIICINDGSTDRSLEIIKEYAKNDERIVIINKKNSGYGDSMNHGLKKATGEYIGIVESDDFIDIDAFEIMYNVAKKNGAEVVKSNYYEYYGETKTDGARSNLFPLKDTGRIIDPRDDRQIFYQLPCIWAAIYKRSFLVDNKIDFLPTPGAAYQDTGFNLKVWSMARRAYFINRAFLHYRQDNSNSSVKDGGKIFFVKDEHDSVEEFLKENGLIEELGSIAFTCRFGSYVWNLHRLKFKAAMKFAEVVKNDYKRAKESGYLDENKLDAVGRHNARLIAMRYPKLYVFLRPLHDFRNKTRKMALKVMKGLSPSYKKRLMIIEEMERLNEIQIELADKISTIESGMSEKNEKK